MSQLLMGFCDDCCDDGCVCVGCLNGVAACCYVIAIGGNSYPVSWSSACQWSSPPDYPEISMSIADEEISVVYDGNTYTAALPADTDCLAISSLELTQEGGAATLTVTAAGSTCLACECYCSECSGAEQPYNATCCWTVYLDSDTYYVLTKTDDCLWEDIGGCGVSISIGSGEIVLTAGESTWTIEYGEEGPNCCGLLAFNGAQGYPVAYPGSASGCTDTRSAFCVAVAISGIGPNNGDCGCPACSSIDGTYYTQSYNPYGNTFLGLSNAVIPLCTEAKPFWRCGYDTLSVSIDPSTNAATASIYHSGTGPAVIMTFTGTYDPEAMTATLSLSSQSGNSADDCDGSSATIIVTVTNIGHYNCPEFAGCSNNSTSCEEPDWSCADDCYANSLPNQVEVTFPSGYIVTNTSITWIDYRCPQPDWTNDLPDGAVVILDNYGEDGIDPGTYDLPNVGGTSISGVYLFIQSDPVTFDECSFAYFSDLQTELCDRGTYYEHVAFQWMVFYNKGDLRFYLRTKMYRAFSPGYVWTVAGSMLESYIIYALTLDYPCGSSNADCWSEGSASRVSSSINYGHRSKPNATVASLAVACS